MSVNHSPRNLRARSRKYLVLIILALTVVLPAFWLVKFQYIPDLKVVSLRTQWNVTDSASDLSGMEGWVRSLRNVATCLMRKGHLFVGPQEVTCPQLKSVDPTRIKIVQDHCYSDQYFQDVPSAQYVKDGYSVTLRPASTDIQVLQQFFCGVDFHYTSYLAPFLAADRPMTVVDAGANIGLASLLFAQVINFNGEIIAVEANPATLQTGEVARYRCIRHKLAQEHSEGTLTSSLTAVYATKAALAWYAACRLNPPVKHPKIRSKTI